MLTDLTIRNYALIESLQIEFDKGLNIFTGETGAGKSIIIDALGLLLGEKASASSVRKDAQRCEVIGIFDIKKNRSVREIIKSFSLQNEESDDELILRREIDSQGKSKSFVNDKSVNLSTLVQIGEFLVDIHGQHEHQRLLKSAEQRDLLDYYSDHESLRSEISQLYEEWKNLESQINASQLSEQEKIQKIDLYKFQIDEIDASKLQPNEDQEIEQLLPQLKNAERLRGWADEIYSQLYDSDGSALERVRKSQKLIESIRSYGIDLKEVPALLEESLLRIDEAVNQIETFRNNQVSDPKKLDELIARQDIISKLKKKYGTTISQILEYREKTNESLKQIESHSETLAELKKKKEEIHARLVKQCKKLSDSRKKIGEKLSLAIQKELKDLGFHKARFLIQVCIEKNENGKEILSSTGFDKIEFLFSANIGEELNPLKNVASGGELSRVMLALKKTLAESDVVTSIVFDEIDSGIGGSMGNIIGEKLKNLSRTHQILVVTHLPQIAAFADRHISVIKSVIHQRTQTTLNRLFKEDQVKEIARMLGGTSGDGKYPTSTSLKHASELLQNAK